MTIDPHYEISDPPITVTTMVGILAVCCSLTNIRLASLQPEDIVLLGLLGFCLAKVILSGFSLRVAEGVSGLLKSYGLLVFTLFCTGILAFRLKFYPLNNASLLKHPAMMSASKLLQFSAVLCGFLWLINTFIKQRRSLLIAINTYWWVGVACSLYAILSYFALATFQFNAPGILGAYSNLDGVVRARGLFNEGGPFGMYVISVYIAGIIRRRIAGRRAGVTCTIILLIAFVMSSSKAGIIAISCLALYFVLSGASFRAKVSYLVLGVTLLGGLAVWLNLRAQLIGYLISYENLDAELATHSDDYNLVLGRVAAMYIVPRMIAEHPLIGIGFGNYPVMRNNPNYLGVLPAVTDEEDLPALGIPSIAAEIGIPVTVWLVVLMFLPYLRSRERAPGFVVGTLFQPLACILAVQLTFFYPWFITACAFAASCTQSEESKTKIQPIAQQERFSSA